MERERARERDRQRQRDRETDGGGRGEGGGGEKTQREKGETGREPRAGRGSFVRVVVLQVQADFVRFATHAVCPQRVGAARLTSSHSKASRPDLRRTASLHYLLHTAPPCAAAMAENIQVLRLAVCAAVFHARQSHRHSKSPRRRGTPCQNLRASTGRLVCGPGK